MKLNNIYNIDCFELLKNLPNNSIDLIITDPPYLISKKTGFHSCDKGVQRFSVSMEFGEWDIAFDNFDLLLKELYRVLKLHGTLIIFFDIWKITLLKNWMTDAKFKQIRFLEWIKTNPVPLNSRVNYLTNSREIALTGTKVSKPTFNSKYDNGIYKFPIAHVKGRIHPTQKPVKLMEELIVKHSNKHDVVLDCFMGSGTTAIAAINQNRQYIGSEINKEYFDHSLQRIEQSGWKKISRTTK